MLAVVPLLSLSLQLPLRRELIIGATAALVTTPTCAYDTLPTPSVAFEAAEKARVARAAAMAKNELAIKPFVDHISKATTNVEYRYTYGDSKSGKTRVDPRLCVLRAAVMLWMSSSFGSSARVNFLKASTRGWSETSSKTSGKNSPSNPTRVR